MTSAMDPNVDLCQIPAGTPPNGGMPNFTDPESLQPTLIAVTAITTSLALVITAGRFYVNKSQLRWADYLMMVAVVFDLASIGLILSISRYYRHIWDVPLCWLNTTYLKITCAEVLIVGPALFFPKAAIFLFYLQIFYITPSVRIGAKLGIVFAFLAYFAPTMTLAYFDAPHVGETWEELLVSGRGLKGVPGGVALGAASILVDLYIFFLPLPNLVKLSLPLAKRIQLIALFATALMGIVASVVCTVYRVKLLDGKDSTWQAGNVSIAIIVENNVAIIVGSLPAFANFLRIYVHDTALVRSLRSKLSSRSGDSKGSTRRSSGGGEKLKRWTVGSSQPRARRDRFQDLDESAIILKSNDSISEDAPTSPRHSPSNSLSSPPLQQVGDRDILRTVEFTRTEMNSPPPPARMV